MVQQDVPEDNHERRDDHTDIDVQILGDLRIVDDGDLLRNEIEVVIFGEGLRLGRNDGCDASRRNIEASDAMNGCMLNSSIRVPVNRPNATPMRIMTTMASGAATLRW